MMRPIRLFLLVTLSSIAAFAQQAPVGIQTADLDRPANPCNDFYQFSNGAWRAANPIPATMDRWSRRWAAGESNKDQLRVILEEASTKRDLPKGSVDQLIGDYYAACMDESRVNQAGATPIKPMLADIDPIKDQASLQQMLLRFADLGRVPRSSISILSTYISRGGEIICALAFRDGVGSSPISFQSSSTDRLAAFRSRVLSLEKSFSMGFRSGE